MAMVTTPVGRLVDALGLKDVRSLRISMEMDSAVSIVTETLVPGDQLGRLAAELETQKWVLVPRDEWEHGPMRQMDGLRLTDAEREAVNDAIYLCEAEARLFGERAADTKWATAAAVLHDLLERLGGER